MSWAKTLDYLSLLVFFHVFCCLWLTNENEILSLISATFSICAHFVYACFYLFAMKVKGRGRERKREGGCIQGMNFSRFLFTKFSRITILACFCDCNIFCWSLQYESFFNFIFSKINENQCLRMGFNISSYFPIKNSHQTNGFKKSLNVNGFIYNQIYSYRSLLIKKCISPA